MLCELIGLDLRRQLVEIRKIAMSRGADDALGGFPVISGTPSERAVLACLKAEILHLDDRDEDALKVFDVEIDPILPQLAPAVRVELLENKSDVQLSTFKGGAQLFYQIVDRRNLLNLPTRDYRRVAEADEAAMRGEHYDALPLYWAELRQSYAGLSWRRREFAHLSLARECLTLGLAAEATYHAMLADERKFIDLLARAIWESNKGAVVSAVVNGGLSTCALLRHSVLIVELIGKVADLLPDSDVVSTIDRLSVWAAAPISTWASLARFQSAWRAIQALSPRLNPAQAERIANIAQKHVALSEGGMGRLEILKSLACIMPSLQKARVGALATMLIDAATCKKQDIDYAAALDAICRAVQHAGDERITAEVLARLYPPGQPIKDAYLLQIAPVLGRQTADREQFNRGAMQAAAAIRKQVEHLEPGTEASNLGGHGTVRMSSEKGNVVVHIFGAQHWIDGIVANKQNLDQATAEELASAMMEVAANDENIISNRYALIRSLGDLSDLLGAEVAAACAAKLQRIAAGDFKESEFGMPHAQAVNPMNPQKVEQGDPADLKGIALVVLAELTGRTKAAQSALREEGLLAAAMLDPEPHVRAHAAVAAKSITKLKSDEVTGLLLLTTDAHADTAATALSAFRDVQRLRLNGPQLAMLLGVLERAAAEAVPVIRAIAAEVVLALEGIELNRKLKGRLDALYERLSHDPAYSVRSQLKPKQGIAKAMASQSHES